MKTYFYQKFLFALILCVAYGCEPQKTTIKDTPLPEDTQNREGPEDPEEHEYGFDGRFPLCVAVMKLTKPEYKNYVLASHTTDYPDYYVGDRGNQCQDSIGKTGYSPYWELPDDWLLVDWKWRLFPYIENVVLTEQTWNKYPWGPQSSSPQWPLTEPHEDNPIEQVHWIKIANLEYYSNANYGKTVIYYISKTTEPFCYYGVECLCEIPEKMDSIWNILYNDLSVAIEKGDLEKINNEEYNPGYDYD